MKLIDRNMEMYTNLNTVYQKENQKITLPNKADNKWSLEPKSAQMPTMATQPLRQKHKQKARSV